MILMPMWLLACEPMHDQNINCENGLDMDGDGACDRERADWSADAAIPEGTDRRDIYGLGADLEAATAEGLVMAAEWPVSVSGMMLPAESFERLFEDGTTDPARISFQSGARNLMGFGTLSEMYAWLGLAAFPESGVPIPADMAPGDPMGAGRVQTAMGPGFTFSCYACHSTEFYGHVIVGLTNRRTRANEYFHTASGFFPLLPPEGYQSFSGATEEELEMYRRAQAAIPSIGSKIPARRGLDTSLAQVALSLARRSPDAWATKNPGMEQSPSPSLLEDFIADSKPAVWWTLRYKTRWLSDGSIVSGNPIFTNFLWNELGRGTDLEELDGWLQAEGERVDLLTVAVFNTPAPQWDDVFPQYPIDAALAEAGEPVFDAHCAGCHGSYEKDWAAGTATVRVLYHPQTPVMDVGTDPQRAEGMADFSQRLNDLEISRRAETVVAVQAGYVPPPLDAVWARFPYLHNASVPSLCALIDPAQRPARFWTGPPDDPATGFDPACVGLPVVPPDAWTLDPMNEMDTTVPGLGSGGHEVAVPEADRAALMEFLKTL